MPPSDRPDTAAQALGEFLAETPFACGLSSGFFGFFAHAGFLLALERAGLRPTRFAGSSAGALSGGVVASGTSATDLVRELERIELVDFWDPSFGLGLLRGDLFQERVRGMLSAQTFDACATPFASSVFNLRTLRTEVLQAGDLASAIRASCSFPFLLQPARRGPHLYLDGGAFDRPGILGIPRHEFVLFHHLIPSSPWRSAKAPSSQIPTRDRLRALAITGLPRSGPFKLPAGKQAMSLAYEATRRALDGPYADSAFVSGSPG